MYTALSQLQIIFVNIIFIDLPIKEQGGNIIAISTPYDITARLLLYNLNNILNESGYYI